MDSAIQFSKQGIAHINTASLSKSHVLKFVCHCSSPRRACAARVTVIGPRVGLSDRLSTFVLELQATRQLMSDIND